MVHVCFCGLFFKCAMNAGFEMTLLIVSSPLIWPKLTFVALPKYERFRDATGYVTVMHLDNDRQFSLSIQPYSSVVPSNLILRIQFLQSRCYNTLHIHPNSSNIRRSIDRHSLPHHNRWKSITNSTLKPLALGVPFVFRSSIYILYIDTYPFRGLCGARSPAIAGRPGEAPLYFVSY